MFDTVKKHPGLSQYELSKTLGWKSGKVDGSIRRLVNDEKVVIKKFERNGRHVNLVYPRKAKETNTIEVPTELLRAGNPTWLNTAHIYALDNSTIGIAGKEIEEWKKISCFREKVPIKRDEEKVAIEIPENFKRFYNTNRRHKVVSISGNAILITVSGNLIEKKKYPS